MDKVIELAKKSGLPILAWEEETKTFYTLARADLEAENARLLSSYMSVMESHIAVLEENAKLKQECDARDQAGYLRGLEDCQKSLVYIPINQDGYVSPRDAFTAIDRLKGGE